MRASPPLPYTQPHSTWTGNSVFLDSGWRLVVCMLSGDGKGSLRARMGGWCFNFIDRTAARSLVPKKVEGRLLFPSTGPTR